MAPNFFPGKIMIIFGIDPGSHATGYGIIKDADGRLSIIDCGTVTTNSKEALSQRVCTIYEKLTELITEYQPDEMAVEDLFNAKNARSSLILGHARGVALLSGAMAKISVAEYAPREVKKALTGNGAATKEQVKFMVMRLLSLREDPGPNDASDALAVAICHSMRRNMIKLTGELK